MNFMTNIELIHQIASTHHASRGDLRLLLTQLDEETRRTLHEQAFQTHLHTNGREVYIRALIEVSNYCCRECLYCGINRQNEHIERYRLSKEEILDCCEQAYRLGFRSFVLQGGEDSFYSDTLLSSLIQTIKDRYPEAALTLSLGERSRASYQNLREAGADRYLLRHETATPAFYQKMHPHASFDNRLRCLRDLMELGYQTGSGFLVGLPDQSIDDLINDLILIQELRPQMVGVGPFIPHHDTSLASAAPGDVNLTIDLLAIVRLLLPQTLLPATTALATLDPKGREKAFNVGANVVMPNMSPFENRSKYALYDGKKHSYDEAGEQLALIVRQIENAGFIPSLTRGDHGAFKSK